MKFKLTAFMILIILTPWLAADGIPKTYDDFLDWKPIKYGIFENYHLPEHTAYVGIQAWAANKLGMNPDKIRLYLFMEMVVYEGYQLYNNDWDPAKIYGSTERWFWDSCGDVAFPYFVTLLILDDVKIFKKADVAYLGRGSFKIERWF